MAIWQKAFDIDLEIPDDFGHWLAGFTAGEGCFVISVDLRKADLGRRKRYAIWCKLAIKLRRDDVAILHEIRDTLKAGTVHLCDENSARWTVCRISEIVNIIIPLFMKYPLRAKKQRDFEIWSAAAYMIHSHSHRNKIGYAALLQMKEMLEKGKKYKYD